MGATFCGKECSACGYREQLTCPGCRMGPGAAVGGDCEIAKCCRDDSRDGCYSCVHQGDCAKRKASKNEAEFRIHRIKREEEMTVRRGRDFPLLARWLSFLFWLTVASTVISFVGNDAFFPQYREPLAFVSAIYMLAYSLALMRLGSICDGYRIAGICGLVFMALDLVGDLNYGTDMVWIFTLAAAVFGFFMEYQEYLAHADTVEELDGELAEQWKKLWLWKLWATIASVASAFLVWILGSFAALIILAASVALIVIAVIKTVYLYRSARLYRNYLSGS